MSFISNILPSILGNLAGNAINSSPQIVSSIINSRAASSAARQQSQAQTDALEADRQARDAALARLTTAYDAQTQRNAPYVQAGNQAVMTLQELLAPGGDLSKSYDRTFTPPTAESVTSDEGYRARMMEGQKALERSAAVRGTLNTGATAKALERFGQEFASNEYNNAFNRSKTEFDTNEDAFRKSQSDRYSRLMGLTQTGQNAAGTAGQYDMGYATGAGGLDLQGSEAAGRAATNLANIGASKSRARAGIWTPTITDFGDASVQGVLDNLRRKRGIIL